MEKRIHLDQQTETLTLDALSTLTEIATQATFRAIVKAEIFLNRTLPIPEIVYNLRGKTAGIFQYECVSARRHSTQPPTLRIRFNPTLLATHRDVFLNEVVPHEVSHLAVHCYYQNQHYQNQHLSHNAGHKRRRVLRPHGPEWQDIMRNCFQLPPKIYHDFPVTSARQHPHPFEYACACRKHYFTARRHKNRLHGTQYLCRHCGEPLRYMGKITS
ncbi:MAG: SprT-like domain-containing protein [Gammaproteobacteria bacterium]